MTAPTAWDKEVWFYDDLIKDKSVRINFIYSRCADGNLPLITAHLVQVQRLLGDRVGRDIFMYSITLNPRHDSPRVMRDYGVGAGWPVSHWSARRHRVPPADAALHRYRSGRRQGSVTAQRNVRYGNEPLMQ